MNDGQNPDELSRPIRIKYNEGPPGCGKSRYLQQLAATVPGRYLYATPTVRTLEESAAAVAMFAREADITPPLIVPIHSKFGAGRRSVSRAIAEDAGAYLDGAHVVILCTHEGLTTATLSNFSGWFLFIDEVPNIIESGTFCTPASSAVFKEYYSIDPVIGTKWSLVRTKPDVLGTSIIERDMLLQPLAAFHRRAGQRDAW